MKKWGWKIALAAFLVIAAIWIGWNNVNLERTDYTIASSELPEAFEGFRIVHLSDLHNASFGPGNERLLEIVKEAKPDMIAITGDLIDSRNTNVETALAFAQEAVKIAPCYYVAGNHELRLPKERRQLEQGLKEAGVTVLCGQGVTLSRQDQSITVFGLEDVSAITKKKEEFPDAMAKLLAPLDGQGYSILLFHRPICFPVYADYGMELVLTGHNHGGQFRLPWLGGLYCSGELFHKYDAGVFSYEDTNMVVSRGLGNSLIPFRINNNPEVVVITLTGEKGA